MPQLQDLRVFAEQISTLNRFIEACCSTATCLTIARDPTSMLRAAEAWALQSLHNLRHLVLRCNIEDTFILVMLLLADESSSVRFWPDLESLAFENSCCIHPSTSDCLPRVTRARHDGGKLLRVTFDDTQIARWIRAEVAYILGQDVESVVECDREF